MTVAADEIERQHNKLVQQDESEAKRKLALLKAVGLDRAQPEQRELALAIAKRYDLDLLLKHLVLIEGRPFLTRDALLWIAHRSGQFDGMEVTEPVIKPFRQKNGSEKDFWTCYATVWRKDMNRPAVKNMPGRYPVDGMNANFGPEMAIKVAESMAFRRAFNVSAPTQDERWDAEVPVTESEPPKALTLAERAAQKAAELTSDTLAVGADIAKYRDAPSSEFTPLVPGQQAVDLETGEITEVTIEPDPKEAATTTAKQTTSTTESATADSAIGRCASVSKLSGDQCRLFANGHMLHRTDKESWADADAVQ